MGSVVVGEEGQGGGDDGGGSDWAVQPRAWQVSGDGFVQIVWLLGGCPGSRWGGDCGRDAWALCLSVGQGMKDKWKGEERRQGREGEHRGMERGNWKGRKGRKGARGSSTCTLERRD